MASKVFILGKVFTLRKVKKIIYINKMFKYKELIKRLDRIEENLSNQIILEKTNIINSIEKKFYELYQDTKTNNDLIYQEISLIKDEKIDKILNEKIETIKHQLFLENELKKTIQDIENLSITIHNTIELINYTIYKIDNTKNDIKCIENIK